MARRNTAWYEVTESENEAPKKYRSVCYVGVNSTPVNIGENRRSEHREQPRMKQAASVHRKKSSYENDSTDDDENKRRRRAPEKKEK